MTLYFKFLSVRIESLREYLKQQLDKGLITNDDCADVIEYFRKKIEERNVVERQEALSLLKTFPQFLNLNSQNKEV